MTKMIFVLAVAALMIGCQKQTSEGPSTGGAQSPFEFAEPNTPSREATDFDRDGYESFKASTPQGADVSHEFLQKYSGRFPEEKANIKVDGNLVIDQAARRIQMTVRTNRYFRDREYCTIELNSPIEKVTSDTFGYRVWVETKSLSRKTLRCLQERMEPLDFTDGSDLVGIQLDYYNANTLRLSLQDAYIFFLRDN